MRSLSSSSAIFLASAAGGQGDGDGLVTVWLGYMMKQPSTTSVCVPKLPWNTPSISVGVSLLKRDGAAVAEPLLLGVGAADLQRLADVAEVVVERGGERAGAGVQREHARLVDGDVAAHALDVQDELEVRRRAGHAEDVPELGRRRVRLHHRHRRLLQGAAHGERLPLHGAAHAEGAGAGVTDEARLRQRLEGGPVGRLAVVGLRLVGGGRLEVAEAAGEGGRDEQDGDADSAEPCILSSCCRPC